MARRREMATYLRMVVEIEHGKFAGRIRPEEVRVMARAEGYAMVRKKGAVPFVVSEKELSASSPATGEKE